MNERYDIAIIGSGAAGISAVSYIDQLKGEKKL